MSLTIQSLLPDSSISPFVHSFWMLQNKTGEPVPSTILPNGMVDMILSRTESGNWRTVIRGIDTMPGQVTIAADALLFSIGFKLLAVEYLLDDSVSDVLNEGRLINSDRWSFDEGDLISLDRFSARATQIIKSLPTKPLDNRKQNLFDLLYSSDGAMTVSELADSVGWSSRQINRYFNQQFGISLKMYCNILRFGASFRHLSEGKLYPEHNFTDQNHFIKEIKKYAGVTPKELSRNKNERFVNITAIRNFPA